jgi:hypothetical protein
MPTGSLTDFAGRGNGSFDPCATRIVPRDVAIRRLNAVFGPRGRHTRMVQANNEMALDCATLVVLIAEV